MAGRAEEIFQLLEGRGEAAVDELIAGGVSEELFLDFKRSATSGAGVRLDDRDRRNLAKAISGFGNSEGGVVLWGVDCRANADGADVPIGKVPLELPGRFKSWLEGASGGVTVPVHNLVRHIAIPRNDAANGFVVSLIPQSDHAPHQMIPDNRYMMRAGSNFLPVPHAVLAGMFGRRPQPRMAPSYLTGRPRLSADGGLLLEVGVMLLNQGPGIAEHSFLTLNIWSTPGPNCTVEFSPIDGARWDGQFNFHRMLSVIARDGIRIPPIVQVLPTTANVTLRPPFNAPLRIEGQCGATGSETQPVTLEATAAQIRTIYETCTVAIRDGQPTDGMGDQFVRMLVGQD